MGIVISIGEDSELKLSQSSISNSNIKNSCKDKSKSLADNITLTNNKITFAAFKKKEELVCLRGTAKLSRRPLWYNFDYSSIGAETPGPVKTSSVLKV